MSASNKKPYTIHKSDTLIDKASLKEVLDDRGMEYMELWEKIREQFGLDLSYKGFMSLIDNRSNWKLVYAWAISDVLDIQIKDLFKMTVIDVEAKQREKEEWKKKYQK